MIDGAGGAELDGLAGARVGRDPKRHRLPLRVLHLGRDRAHPDQLVESVLVGGELRAHVLRRAEAVARGADRLVRLLRVLDLPLVAARLGRNVVGAEERGHLLARGRERRLRQRRRVGAHVRDVAVLVQALRDPHRRLRGVTELAARLLLQRRGHERRARAADVRLSLDARNLEGGALEPVGEPTRSLLVELARLAAELPVGPEVAARSPRAGRRERRAAPRTFPDRTSRPMSHHAAARNAIRSRSRCDDEPRRHRLDATGREPAHDLLPEDRRDLVAVEPVEDAPRLLRVDEPLVDVAGLVERLLDRVAGDLVEDHPADGHLRLQHLEQVPGDRLALAILVRREQQLVGVRPAAS